MDGKIVYKDGREEILKYGITEIPEKAYYQNKEIVRVVLPSSVKRIGAYAFMECGLISVLFSNSLISIGKGAFSCGGAALWPWPVCWQFPPFMPQTNMIC